MAKWAGPRGIAFVVSAFVAAAIGSACGGEDDQGGGGISSAGQGGGGGTTEGGAGTGGKGGQGGVVADGQSGAGGSAGQGGTAGSGGAAGQGGIAGSGGTAGQGGGGTGGGAGDGAAGKAEGGGGDAFVDQTISVCKAIGPDCQPTDAATDGGPGTCGPGDCWKFCIKPPSVNGPYCSAPCASNNECSGFYTCCGDLGGKLPQKMCLPAAECAVDAGGG